MAIIGNRAPKPVSWLTTGMKHARRVGRIQGPQARATGFLFEGERLGENLRGLPFFLTAAHFFHPSNPPAFGPHGRRNFDFHDYSVVFEGMFDDNSVNISAQCELLVLASHPQELDFALLLLDRWPGSVEELNIAPRPPKRGEPLYIFGYPLGEGLSVSLQDNEVVSDESLILRRDPLRHRIYYQTPTLPGSSGSPVFNEFWELVAMHLGGGYINQAATIPRQRADEKTNFGVLLEDIIGFIRSNMGFINLPSGLADRIRSASFRSNIGKGSPIVEHHPQAPAPPAPVAPASRGSAAPSPEDAIKTPVPNPKKAARKRAKKSYSSAFISYSHEDRIFVDRLYNSLRMNGIRTWLDTYKILPGDDIYDEIASGILNWDKVLLCCSKKSLNSWWVESELDRVFEKERTMQKEQKKKVLTLIPIDLDGFLFDGWESGKAQVVRSRLAADFKGWEDEDKFNESFQMLLRALRSDPGGRDNPPPKTTKVG